MITHVIFGTALILCMIGLVVFRVVRGKSPGVMNIILLISALLLAWFTVTMIQLFREYGMIPDTLVSCVFMALAGEAGIMGWIKTNKEKYRERRWQKERLWKKLQNRQRLNRQRKTICERGSRIGVNRQKQ